jgi:hypothetical protein
MINYYDPFDLYTGHSYVEIGGLKWATMNIGAESIIDTGLYFQWGDTQGYTALQVGSGDGQKYFGWADYKYGDGTSNPDASDLTKYNITDNKTTLERSDDAASSNWGGLWRIPTSSEFQSLVEATTSEWTEDYQNSGVRGTIFTDKTDNSKVLFFPAAGVVYNGSVSAGSNSSGRYWSSSLVHDPLADLSDYSYELNAASYSVSADNSSKRFIGLPIRGVAN